MHNTTTSQITQWVAVAVAAVKPFAHIIMLLDAAPQHLSNKGWCAISRNRVWQLLVPAGLTWLLQPLHTHAFAKFKVSLQRKYQEERIKKNDGTAGVVDLVASLQAAISEVLEALG